VTVVLAVTWVARAGEEDRVAGLLATLAEHARREPGCEAYVPCRDPEDVRRFFLYERYTDEEALAAHDAAEHTRVYGFEGAIPLLESRVRTIWRPLELSG
jgi:(4S)-4-hydroxy-5-phosphonooxypentane-2,3-dione isomerase